MKTRPWRWLGALAALFVLALPVPSGRSQDAEDAEETAADPPPATPPAAMVDVRSRPLPRLQPPRSLSTSKQFVVFAENGALRVSIGLLGDDAREGLQRLLGPEATERWKIPIVVDLRRPTPGLPGTPTPSRLTLGQTGTGLKIQLEMLLGEAGRTVRTRAEITRALLLEIAYRDTPALPAGRPYLLPPVWLVEGVAAYLDARADETGVVADDMAQLLASPRPGLPLCDFLAHDPTDFDTPSRTLYRAYAYGLVRLVAEELPGGRDALLALLRALPGNVGTADAEPAPLLARLLPDGSGREPAMADRWWTAARVRFAEAQLATNLLSAAESERRLAALLFVNVPADAVPPKSKNQRPPPPPPSPADPPAAARVVPLEEFARREDPGTNARRAALAPLRAGLEALLGRAHPLYRPIIAGYEATVIAWARGGADIRRAPARLRTLAAERTAAHARSEAVADYLNWFEATQPSQLSDSFDGYFETLRKNNENLPGRHRKDPISAYLDAMEAEF